jgi:high-affinity nickel-transport protein
VSQETCRRRANQATGRGAPGPETVMAIPATRKSIIRTYGLLLGLNAAAWAWALISFHHHPVLLGTAMLAYSFGLRHAVDADHIAAIDTVTRKLMQDNRPATGVGLFFSFGHSLILLIATAVIALTVASLQGGFTSFNNTAGIIGTTVSAGFLLVMAVMNLFIARSVYRVFANVRAGGAYVDSDFDMLLNGRGFLSRLLRPLFKLVSRSWHMLFIGFLFGLGFDTATEVSLLSISGAEAAKGISVWSIMAFPALFAAGMSLVDATDSLMMVGAYGWAFIKPIRKLYYNLTITIVSALVALTVGGIETLGLVGSEFNLGGGFWNMIGAINDRFGIVGYAIIGIFALSWIVSLVVYRANRFDDLQVNSQPG